MIDPIFLKKAKEWASKEVPESRPIEAIIKPSLEEVLVFSAVKNIFVLDNKPNAKPKKIASRDNYVLALCSHNGKLYDGSYKKIYETLSGKKIASRDNFVWALCSHPREYFVNAGVLER